MRMMCSSINRLVTADARLLGTRVGFYSHEGRRSVPPPPAVGMSLLRARPRRQPSLRNEATGQLIHRNVARISDRRLKLLKPSL